jgi:hypothetical protein
MAEELDCRVYFQQLSVIRAVTPIGGGKLSGEETHWSPDVIFELL